MTIDGINNRIVTGVAQTADTGKVTGSGQGKVTTVTVEPRVTGNSGGEQKQYPFAEQGDSYQIQDISSEKVKSAVDDINKKIKPTHTYCQFAYHDETNRISITVKDEAGDVIREIPPEKTLDMIAKVWELAGILVDEKR